MYRLLVAAIFECSHYSELNQESVDLEDYIQTSLLCYSTAIIEWCLFQFRAVYDNYGYSLKRIMGGV